MCFNKKARLGEKRVPTSLVGRQPVLPLVDFILCSTSLLLFKTSFLMLFFNDCYLFFHSVCLFLLVLYVALPIGQG